MPYTMKFIVIVCAAFFARVKPVSTSAKPACMNITRKPATSVQTKLTDVLVSATALATSSIFGGAASAASATAGMRNTAASSVSVRVHFIEVMVLLAADDGVGIRVVPRVRSATRVPRERSRLSGAHSSRQRADRDAPRPCVAPDENVVRTARNYKSVVIGSAPDRGG